MQNYGIINTNSARQFIISAKIFITDEWAYIINNFVQIERVNLGIISLVVLNFN